jgi:tetratricopeptide (TPR) repeat protein
LSLIVLLAIPLAGRCAPGAGSAVAPCSVSIGGFHIGLKHISRGNCASSPVPQASQAPVASSAVASNIGYSHTCDVEGGARVCTTRDGAHVQRCTSHGETWDCSTQTVTAPKRDACASQSVAGIAPPRGASATAGNYSIAAANVYARQKDWNGLLRYSESWTHDRPADSMGWNYLGNTYGFAFHQDLAAADAFRHVIGIKPNWTLPWIGLGHAFVDQNCFEEASVALVKAARLDPHNAHSWNNAVASYTYAGEWGLAQTTLAEEERAIRGTATGFDWYNLGNAFNKLLMSGDAISAYKRSLAANARYAYAWNNLGVAEQAAGNSSEALGDYKRAQNLGDPISAGNYNQLNSALIASTHRGRGGSGGYRSGSGSGGGSGGGASGGGCMYSSEAACNAAAQGEYWAADREESQTASASEDAWYGGSGENVAPAAASESGGE